MGVENLIVNKGARNNLYPDGSGNGSLCTE